MTTPPIVRLTVVGDEIQAAMVQGMLSAAGILSDSRRSPLGGVHWGEANVGAAGPIEIMVYASELAAARELLDKAPSADG